MLSAIAFISGVPKRWWERSSPLSFILSIILNAAFIAALSDAHIKGETILYLPVEWKFVQPHQFMQ